MSTRLAGNSLRSLDALNINAWIALLSARVPARKAGCPSVPCGGATVPSTRMVGAYETWHYFEGKFARKFAMHA